MDVGETYYQVGYNINGQFHPTRHYNQLIIRKTKRGALKMIEKMKEELVDAWDLVVACVVIEEIVPKTPHKNTQHD